jgi:hypothetical protein
MKHLAGKPRQSTCLTTDECQGWPDSRPQKVNINFCSTLNYKHTIKHKEVIYKKILKKQLKRKKLHRNEV